MEGARIEPHSLGRKKRRKCVRQKHKKSKPGLADFFCLFASGSKTGLRSSHVHKRALLVARTYSGTTACRYAGRETVYFLLVPWLFAAIVLRPPPPKSKNKEAKPTRGPTVFLREHRIPRQKGFPAGQLEKKRNRNHNQQEQKKR